MPDLRFPIGKFILPDDPGTVDRQRAVDGIAEAPAALRLAVAGLDEGQLDTPYRLDGWTVRQVVHHLPDSHLNSYTRLKLALTEDVPTIRTYEEARWAQLADYASPVSVSLDLLDALHVRWVLLFRQLDDHQWTRRFRHPDLGEMRVDQLAALYYWHGRHHIAHVTSLRQRSGW